MAFINGTPPDVRLNLSEYGHYRQNVLLKKRKIGEWHRFFPSDPGGPKYALVVYRQGLDDYILLTAEETGVQCEDCGQVTSIGACRACASPVFVLKIFRSPIYIGVWSSSCLLPVSPPYRRSPGLLLWKAE